MEILYPQRGLLGTKMWLVHQESQTYVKILI